MESFHCTTGSLDVFGAFILYEKTFNVNVSHSSLYDIPDVKRNKHFNFKRDDLIFLCWKLFSTGRRCQAFYKCLVNSSCFDHKNVIFTYFTTSDGDKKKKAENE